MPKAWFCIAGSFTKKKFEEINYLHGARLFHLSVDQLMLAHGQVLAGFEADCLHSSRLFSTQRANEEVTENVLVPIKLILISSGRTVGPGALETSLDPVLPAGACCRAAKVECSACRYTQTAGREH